MTSTAHFGTLSQRAARNRVSDIWRSNIVIGYLLISLGCSIFAGRQENTFLTEDTLDGFTIQVTYIWNYFDGGNSLFDLEPLLWIHSVRALIATIFVWLEDTIGVGGAMFLTLMLFIPVLDQFSRLPRGFIVFLVPFTSIVFSSRTILVIVSVAYLVTIVYSKRSFFYLAISFVFSLLSSGAVLNNVVIASLVVRNHRPKSISLYVYIISLAISLLISATDKYEGFAQQRAGYASTVYGAEGLWALASRSTIFVSFQEGNVVRSLAYLSLVGLALALVFLAVRKREYRGYIIILLSVIPAALLEGLGFISLLIPLLLLVAGQPLPWSPKAKIDV